MPWFLLLLACPEPVEPEARSQAEPALTKPEPALAIPAGGEVPPAPENKEEASPDAPGGLPSGAACLDASQCASGVCEGEGCDEASPGLCAPATRACTRDLRQYCGCDEETFQASSSCPGNRYSYEGPCAAFEEDVEPPPGG